MRITKSRLKSIISRFRKKNILVVGDLILDHHIFGKVERISPEAPVPVVWAKRQNFICGGAANVGLNLKSLGAGVSLCGVRGKDEFGRKLLSLAVKHGINPNLVVTDKQRPTTLKTRIMAHHQQVVRVDWEAVDFLSVKTNNLLMDKISRNIDKFDAVILEDYGKGVVSPGLAQEVADICRRNKTIVTVDPKEEHFESYRDVTALTPNLKEAESLAKMKIKNRREIIALGKAIISMLHPKALLITLGEDGMALFFDGNYRRIPTAALEVFDVTGAGDTVISAFTLSLACGASFPEAAVIANFAAGIVVGKLGAASASQRELVNIINENRL